MNPICLPDNLTLDPATGVWAPPSREQIDYTEGRQTERELMAILRAADDLSAFNPDLVPADARWELEYHLHPDRGNVVAGLEFDDGASILEIGAGCGAISRVLGEATTGSVVALEGARARAEICAVRTRDLDNTSVIAAPLGEVDFGPVFDVVVVIGVLEYAAKFIDDVDDPHDEFIRRCVSQLRPGGTLVLAIENQLGLKYLAGAREDHTGRPFDGPEGYPHDAHGPRTFGRRQLRELIGRHLSDTEVLLAFPDYKLPAFIASEALASEIDLSAIIRHSLPAAQPGHLASEQLLTRTFAANGLTADTANSFIIIAHDGSRQPAARTRAAGILFGRRTSNRPTRCTTISTSTDGAMVVDKHIESKSDEWPQSTISWQPSTSDWIEGESVADIVLDIARAGGSVSDIADAARIWCAHLDPWLDGSDRLPGSHLDATWANTMVDSAGAAHLIDLEWVNDTPVSIAIPLFRSLETAIRAARAERLDSPLRTMTELDLRSAVARHLDISLDQNHDHGYLELITELNFVAFGSSRQIDRRRDALKRRSGRLGVLYMNSEPARRSASVAALRALRKLEIEFAKVRSR